MQDFLLTIAGYFLVAMTFIASVLGKATCLAIFDSILK